jgi:hypothetical protein
MDISSFEPIFHKMYTTKDTVIRRIRADRSAMQERFCSIFLMRRRDLESILRFQGVAAEA